ncbi:MAG: metallophosphoesterase [Balneolaceae bacterium]|nr:MAG: metallophosphoesterase [Balneolaceae bacterium]
MKHLSILFTIIAGFFQLASAQHYIASPSIVTTGSGDTISGYVFEDSNRNGLMDENESGVPDVLVSNGRDWVRTDENGFYSIDVREDMDLTIVQPSGWRVPVNESMVPQFFYIHKPGGTGYEMRFGGLEDTGPAPGAVHFPLIRDGASSNAFSCAFIADPQTYSNQQIGWLRDGVIATLNRNGLGSDGCMVLLGDVVGDDLDLLDRLLEVTATAGVPQWLVIGNHDIDFDAKSNADKADSWRRIFGPSYYAFEKGNVLFVVLDNVIYPCGEEDIALGRTHCEQDGRYNGRVTETQLQWLETLIRETPEDRLIVLNHHIPFVSFVDHRSLQHQTDQLYRIHDMVEGRPVLSLSGHTHTTENHAPGQLFEGWTEATGAGPLPFRHIIAGAGSGAWYQGDYNHDGVPMSLQRMGAPMGYFLIDFAGNEYVETYVGAGLDPRRTKWVSLNTPHYRVWYNAIREWLNEPPAERDPVPPYSIQDLGDLRLLEPADLEEGVWLTANVWGGSAETSVEAHLPDGTVLQLERTQQGEGEGAKMGAEWADPFATSRQLSVARYSYQSRSGDERAQGHELFRGSSLGPAPPQPQSSVADRNMHLWRTELPQLPLGVHTLRVVSTDRHGRQSTERITIEVREERPPLYWRNELWD